MARLTADAFGKSSKAKETKQLQAFLASRSKREPTQFERFQQRVKVPPQPTFGQSISRVMDDITAAGVGINKAVAGTPGLVGDIGQLWGMGMDAIGVDKASGWRTPGEVLAKAPTSEETIGWWEDVAGKLPDPKSGKGKAIALAAELFTPTPGGKKKLVTLQDVAKAKGVSPVDLANSYTTLKYGARRGPKDTAPEEWVKEVVETPSAPVKQLKLEDLEGQTITMTPGDTATIDTIIGVNGRPLVSPVNPGGGPRYTVDPKRMAQGAAWAGAPSPTSAAINRTKKLVEEGHSPVMAHGTMGFDAIDYNSSVIDAVLSELQTGKYTKKALKSLDDYVRQNLLAGPQKVDGFDPKAFPGIKSPEAIEKTRAMLLTNQPGIEGKIRTMMTKALDKRAARELGAPEIGPIRFAMTDDDFAMLPPQRVGGSIFRVDPNGKPLPSDHGTYSAGVPGTPVGRLEDPIPAGYLFNDWSQANGARVNPEGIMFSTDWYTFGRQAPSQKITPELLDFLKTRKLIR